MLSVLLAAALAAPAQPARVLNEQGVAPPGTGLVALFSTNDYPKDAIRGDEQGTVAVNLTIGPDGRVSGCEVTLHASPSLDERTCSILVERARYQPARDRKGRPTVGKDSARIRWLLPRPQLRLPDLAEATLIFSDDDRVSGCEGRLVYKGKEVAEAAEGVCREFASMPPELVREIKAASSRPLPQLKISYRWLGATDLAMTHSTPPTGERLLSSRRIDVEYDATGTRVGCATTESAGVVGVPLLADCDRVRTEVDPQSLPAGRNISLAMAVYLIGE